MLQPLVRRTWALRGQTPVHRSWDRHDRLSVICALTVSPRRRQVGLYFQVHRNNIRTEQAVQFMRALRASVGNRLMLVWDRLNVHRAAAKVLQRNGALPIEWLPPYAPDLNPVEQVWNSSKYCTLANFVPDHIDDLADAVTSTLAAKSGERKLLRGFFRHAGLFL